MQWSLMKQQPSHLETSLPVEVSRALTDGTCAQLVLSKPLAKRDAVTQKVVVRPVKIKERLQFQFALTQGQQEVHENLTPEAAVERATRLWEEFREGYLYTQSADFHFQKTKKGTVRLKQHAPTKADLQQVEPHNRSKQYLIPEGTPCPFLEAIGVMTSSGKVKSSQYRKFRQINRYLEFIRDIVPGLPTAGTLKIIDFGCGKSYLTFATHYFFTEVLKRDVAILGLDLKQSVIEDCQRIANQLECKGLTFRAGDISQLDESTQQCDLSISLHACDTATDAALAAAIHAQASVILAVPCCQHEIFQQLASVPLEALLQHGILKEKTAALVTDALRAQVLEICGYRAQVVEFIDTEHTPKNLLIKAVRRQGEGNAGERSKAIAQYESLKQQFGINSFFLEQALGDSLQNLIAAALQKGSH